MTNKERILEFFSKNHIICAKDLIAAFPKINRATVYRNINKLVEEGAIKEVETINDETFYEIMDADHFGHFICNACGDIEELQIDSTVIQNLISSNHIESNHIQINVKGQCSKCL